MKINVNYKQELFAQKTPYLQWLKQQETELERQYGQQSGQDDPGKQVYTLPFSSCTGSVPGGRDYCADAVYLFVKSGGKLSEYTRVVFSEAFFASADVVMVYADEDYRGSLQELYGIPDGMFAEADIASWHSGDGRAGSCVHYRGAPWFKPDFSPDTIASFFYIGSVFAVRGDLLLEMTGKYGSDISIHEFVYRVFADALDRKRQGRHSGIVHIPKVLYTNDALCDAERVDGSGKVRTLYAMADGRSGTDPDTGKVSVVIPSKDNAHVLQKCLETLVRHTDYGSYEIIVVDNGSSPEQKTRVTDVIDALKKEKTGLVIRYLYREEAFNFSAMCNAGARSADGEYLLFLNDDIEVMEDGGQWLDRMAAYAGRSHVGAVGAKLYYPAAPGDNGCYRIQHAGITNMGIGPAHKLGGMLDEGCLYHGHNTLNYDMLAVTAACMLVRKSVFDAAGGFDETFPVAYNDVELCFRLYQKGYFNVQVNEVVLIHHESLSRGRDTSPDKLRRLAADRERLYQKHPLLNARDPFYSPNLVQWKKDVGYNTEYLYAFDRQSVPVLLGDDGAAGKRKRAVLKKSGLRASLHARCGLAAKIYDRLAGYHDMLLCIDSIRYGDGITGDKITDNNLTDDILEIEGWCAVRNVDNADLPRKLWLIEEGNGLRNVYELDIAPKLREDVAALLEDEEDEEKRTRNTALSGIHVNVRENALKPGTYRIGVVCRNRLVCDPETYVTIPAADTGDNTKEKEREV